MIRIRHFAQAIAAFGICGLLSALVVWSVLPSPPGDTDHLSFIAKLLVLCLIGPITFVWAWGPHPLSIVAMAGAILVPTSSIALLHFGYLRGRSLALLATSAVIWSSFGGYSSYLAVAGSI